jgi:acetylglutamate kinase
MLTTPEVRSECLIEALPYIQKYRGQTFVIKYGGSAMEDDQIVDKFLSLTFASVYVRAFR